MYFIAASDRCGDGGCVNKIRTDHLFCGHHGTIDASANKQAGPKARSGEKADQRAARQTSVIQNPLLLARTIWRVYMKLKPPKVKKKPGLIDRNFRVPLDVIVNLEKLAHPHLWGSTKHAIEVGTQLLIRMRRKPKIRENAEPASAVWQTYTITPHTLDLIDQLLRCYEKRATVLRAVVQVLQEQL